MVHCFGHNLSSCYMIAAVVTAMDVRLSSLLICTIDPKLTYFLADPDIVEDAGSLFITETYKSSPGSEGVHNH